MTIEVVAEEGTPEGHVEIAVDHYPSVPSVSAPSCGDEAKPCTLVFQSHESVRVFVLTADGIEYSVLMADMKEVVPPEQEAAFGVTTIAGTYATDGGFGTVLIVVNCGCEPPLLQLVLRSGVTGMGRCWFSQITHHIQEEIIDFMRSRW